MIRYKTDDSYQFSCGTASLYKKISDTHYVILTAAHNFLYHDDQLDNTFVFLDGTFSL